MVIKMTTEERLTSLETKFDLFMTESREARIRADARMDKFEDDMRNMREKHDADMREMNQRFDAKFDKINERFDKVNDRFDSMYKILGGGYIVGIAAIIVSIWLKWKIITLSGMTENAVELPTLKFT